jgi:SAM-dependent methyltransferase
MYDPEYVFGIFSGHLRRLLDQDGILHGSSLLELGPGNSLAQAFLFHTLGVSEVVAVDVRRYATERTGRGVYGEILNRMPDWISTGRLPPQVIDQVWRKRAEDLLTPGTSFPRLSPSFRYELTDGQHLPLPDGKIDFAYSCSVLEHVRDPEGIYHELARALRPGGLMSHIIDLRDHHHPDPLDFLRYGDRLWSLMQGRSAGWTNRLRSSDHLGLMERAGFKILEAQPKVIDALPPPESLDPRFQGYTAEDLRIVTLVVTARRR